MSEPSQGYRDEYGAQPTKMEPPLNRALVAAEQALDRAEKAWEDLGMRLGPILSQEEMLDSPLAVARERTPGSSQSVLRLKEIEERLERWADRLRRITQRLEV